MTSARVYAYDNKRNRVECRVLLDTCATANFVSERFVKNLRAAVIPYATPVGAINAITTVSAGMVRIAIQSRYDDFRKELTCLVIPTIAEQIPSEDFPRNLIEIPSNIRLADPEFHLPRCIDILIGSGATLSLFSIGQINLSREGHDLYLQKTRLGWVIAGSTGSRVSRRLETCRLTNLETQLDKFWSIEEVTADKPNSREESECEAHFVNNFRRTEDGRYVVRLPFRTPFKHLGESRTLALKRFSALERKFLGNATLKQEYTRAIEEYLEANYISVVQEPEEGGYYMPHHAVMKETSSTTKVRVVFDASAKTSSGASLNDALLVGPTIQNTLFTHLLRFRTYKYVITADIKKMYLQVLLHPDDRPYQRILWRRGHRVETLQFNTLAFGVSSSSFLAIRTLHQLAKDERHSYPRVSRILETNLYVYDLLCGASSVEEARAIRDELIALLAKGGFSIRQWASNEGRVINDLANSALHASYVFDTDRSIKTLGITWRAQGDKIHYSSRPIEVAERITKRNILSEIAKIFDPLGLLGPVILHAKRLMQIIWQHRLDWDESVPQSVYASWIEFVQQLELVNQVSFDRGVLTEDPRDVQLHGFVTRAAMVTAHVLYVRSSGKDGENPTAKLLCAKSRVAPLKTITMPRLELCGALTLARLHEEASRALDITPNRTVFWCDSTIVLHWIKTEPHQLNTFVANRVAEIQRLTNPSQWRHVKSESNPADALSRGQLPRAFVRNRMWSTGPEWLIRDERDWPDDFLQTCDIPELRRNMCMITVTDDYEIFEKYSSYSKLLRVIAYCRRFRPGNTFTGALCYREIDEAEVRVLKNIQTMRFADEIKNLGNKGFTGKDKITKLSPFLDNDGLIRVGGRLQNSHLAFASKHPILLLCRHRVTDCIIRETHERHHHSGLQATLYNVRQKYWPIDGKNQVRRILRECVRCSRYNSGAVEYRMGNLPSARVQRAAPFAHTGIDYCGPFFIKERKHRNRARIKTYICIFVCMSIKAVHLEVVSDLTTDGFIAALRRFIARRGSPEHIYSDNGTNFVGANNQLKEMYALFNSEKHQNIMSSFAAERHIAWHFIPPAAPHFGGLWESTVRMFKHHFKRVVGDSLFTFEELNTFCIEVEGILNSRPITSLSSDPNDLQALSPAHYLIGRSLTALPEGELLSVPVNRLSAWQHISKVRQDFWARWHLEYLNELQTRSKWSKDGPKLHEGNIVLIKDKTLPCSRWALGRIIKTHPGEDGRIRAVTLKTAGGEMKRATRYLCPLPIEQEAFDPPLT